MHDAPTEAATAPSSFPLTRVAPWWHTALLAALLIAGSLFNASRIHGGGLGSHHIERYISGILEEAVLFLLVWWGLRLQRVRVADLLGFRRGALAQDFGAAAAFWVFAIAVLACIGIALRLAHLGQPQKALAALAPKSGLEMLLWIALSATAGFVEEFVFRGYFLRQFASPLHQLWIGVVASSLLFGCSHAYEGAAGMIAITVYGALFCGLAILRRSLRPGMIAHAWHDIFTGLMLALAHHLHAL